MQFLAFKTGGVKGKAVSCLPVCDLKNLQKCLPCLLLLQIWFGSSALVGALAHKVAAHKGVSGFGSEQSLQLSCAYPSPALYAQGLLILEGLPMCSGSARNQHVGVKGDFFMAAEVVGAGSSLFGSRLLNCCSLLSLDFSHGFFKIKPICWIFSWLCKRPRSCKAQISQHLCTWLKHHLSRLKWWHRRMLLLWDRDWALPVLP